MKSSISEEFFKAGQALATASNINIANSLNQRLNDFLVWPFKAVAGNIIDLQNQKTDIFSTLICSTASSDLATETIEISVNKVACAIDASENLDLEDLHVAYDRIVRIKKLKKSTAPQTNGVPRTETMGIILAVKAAISLETLAEELQQLNQQTASAYWPDMIVVLSQGTISYRVQFPGERTAGNFLLPAKDIVENSAPAIYVVPVMKPASQHSFNQMCALLFGHLAIFSPGVILPNMKEILAGVPDTGIILAGYQFNLSGKLLPVPPQFYIRRYLPPPPHVFKDKRHNISFTIEFMPWQDGGIILLRGKIPLQGLLVFLDDKIQGRLSTVTRGELQISSILPISQADYLLFLQRVQHQTNFTLQKIETKIIKQKFADEGTSSPFMARLFIGILTLSDAVFQEQSKRNEFDNIYNTIIMDLCSIRTTLQEIVKLFSEHVEKVVQGKIVKIDENSIHVNEDINSELRKQVGIFIYSAARILKNGMQALAKFFNINIGFLFQKDNAFLQGIEKFEAFKPDLAHYIREARKWSDRLNQTRNNIDHPLWQLPNVEYLNNSNSIQVEEPQVSGQPVTEFVKFIFDRLICFIEDVTMYCIQAKLPKGISLTEIPLSQRKSEMPLRFRLILTTGITPVWNINYNQNSFEEK